MDLYNIEMDLCKKNTIYTFSGIVTYNLLTTISSTLRKDLEKIDSSSNKLVRLYSIITEIFQNIMNYSARTKYIDEKDIGIGTCVVKQTDDKTGYIISSGNLIESKDTNKIEEKLNKIISLDKDGVKAYYKEVRRSGKDAHKNGAGLGFLELAKKSEQKLKYQINKIDERYSYFEIEVAI
jgi:hypothetical protein